MKTMLNSLMQLQSVDNKLQALEALKGDLPQQIQKLNDELQSLKDRHEAEKNSLVAAKKSKLHWEGELKVIEEKLHKYQEQLYAVTTNKEYDAITIEIDTAKEKKDESEDNILELIEEEETRTEEEKNLAAQVETWQENLIEKEKELQEKIQATEKESLSYEDRRKELSSSVQRNVLYQYERIRKGLGNSAVAEVRNYACDRCLSTIPPQRVVEIKMMNQLILCESCGRILVHKSENELVTN